MRINQCLTFLKVLPVQIPVQPPPEAVSDAIPGPGLGRRLTKAQQKQMDPLPQELELALQSNPSVVVVPLKRGRPRKSTLLEVQSVTEELEESEQSTTSENISKEPKKRGRPRKSDLQTVQIKAVEQIKTEETDTGSTSSGSNSNSPSNRRISNRLKKKVSGKVLIGISLSKSSSNQIFNLQRQLLTQK